MIYSIGRELEARLRAKGCPFKVVDREAFKKTAWTSGIVVLEETGDTYAPPTSQSINPKRYYDGKIGAKLTIYARSTNAGALEFEHRRLARQVVDIVLVGLRYIRGARRQHIAIGNGSWGDIEDLAGSERKGGVVYELAITVDRGVADVNFAGDAAAEFTFVADSITNRTDVARAGVPEDDGDPLTPETACGA